MIRYEITFDKRGRIFPHTALVVAIVANTHTNHAKVTVHVPNKNSEKFEKLLDTMPEVLEYQAHPMDLESRIKTAKGEK